MTQIVCHQMMALSGCESGQDPAVPHRIQCGTNRSCCPHRTQGSLCLIHCGSKEDRHIDMQPNQRIDMAVEPAPVTEWNSRQQILLRLAQTEEHLSRSIYMRIIALINAALLECPSLSCGKQVPVAMPCNGAEGMASTATDFRSEVCIKCQHLVRARSLSFSRRKIQA
jgi:hypothetical protein